MTSACILIIKRNLLVKIDVNFYVLKLFIIIYNLLKKYDLNIC